MPARLLSRRDVPWLVAVGAVFAITRAGAWVAGVRFDASPITYFWQYAAPELLDHDLARTLWWFHAQPPAFNLLLGSVVQLPDAWQEPLFMALFVAAGLSLAAGAYLLAVHLGVPRGLAAGAALLFAASPTAIVYEHLLFYPSIVALLVVVTFLALARYLATGARAWAGAAFGGAALLVLTRASFHLLWLVALVGCAAVARPGLRRRTIAAAAVPLVLAGGLYVKNWAQFDSFSASTWLGMNLARVAVNEIAPGARTGILDIPPFSPPDAYRLVRTIRPTGIPVLDQERKPGGEPNFNHKVYAEVGDRYLRDALRAIRDEPTSYLRAVWSSMRLYFAPATDQPFVFGNVNELRGYTDAYNQVLLVTPDPEYFVPLTGAPRASRYAPEARHLSWTAVVAYGLALAALPAAIVRVRRGTLDPVRAWVLGAASATVWLLFLAGTFLELGENSRFRVETDPLVYVLVVASVSDLVRSRWRSHPTATAASTASEGSAAARNRVCP